MKGGASLSLFPSGSQGLGSVPGIVRQREEKGIGILDRDDVARAVVGAEGRVPGAADEPRFIRQPVPCIEGVLGG